jgi:hypothetical protein
MPKPCTGHGRPNSHWIAPGGAGLHPSNCAEVGRPYRMAMNGGAGHETGVPITLVGRKYFVRSFMPPDDRRDAGRQARAPQ